MLSKTALNTLKAFVALAGLPKGSYQGAASVADKIGAPQNYLSKQLKALVGSGLVESRKGKDGGFRLGRPAGEITLFDVVEPIDQVSRWEGCFMGGGRCTEGTSCPTHKRWSKVRVAYLDFLTQTTIVDLLGDSQAGITSKPNQAAEG